MIEENVGLYVYHASLKLAYLAIYGLKPEPKLPDFIVPEPEPVDFIEESIITKAQAIWRGCSDRKQIAKDKENLVVRLYKTCEDSKAKISVRKVRVLHTKKIRNTTIETTKNIETKLVNGVI